MSPPRLASVKKASPPDRARNLRGFHRRRIVAKVALVTMSGVVVSGDCIDLSQGGLRFASSAALTEGDEAIADLEFANGAKVEASVRVAWTRQSEDKAQHGVRFESLSADDRLIIVDAIYAHPADGPLAFDVLTPGDEAKPRSSRVTARSLAHNAYYLRLIRRIEQTHKLLPTQTDELLFTVLQQAKELPDALLALNLTTFDKLDQYLGALYGVPFVALSLTKPDAGIADLIPESIALSQSIVPIKRVDGKYLVAMADPLDLPARDIVYLRSKDNYDLRFALIEDVEKAIKAVYQAASLHSADPLINRASATEHHIQLYKAEPEVADLETLRRLSDATPIISLVDSLLRSAVEDRASDIHLEPMDDAIIVRFRLDGVLHEVRTLPRNLLSSVLSRIKIMAGMDITERHIPQDGRISMRYAAKDFELRVASLPTVFGEKIVVRLLEKNPTFKTLRSIGFSERNYQLFAPLIRRPYGMILFCGPTGSGKSTTLFACIQEIHDGTTNITTVEDPVEYRVRGINHIELNPRRNVTFPTVLRSILRSDPDVIYVGEIRDRETADLAIRGALTGHLLFSTLHTNTAIQSITRLVDIGVEGALIGASIIGVVGQRLVRKICDWCKESYAISPAEVVLLKDMLRVDPPETLWRGQGCAHCHQTGFFGRSAVHEVVVIDEGLRQLISTSGNNPTALHDYLRTTDFQDLRTDAVDRLLKGETTVQEVIRVTI